MATDEIAALNRRLAVPGHVTFEAGPGGIPVVAVRNERASATIDLQGADVIAWQPAGRAPVLWLSRNARFAPRMPIRGGIPICWPWFGPHPTDRSLPDHGFARTSRWAPLGVEALDLGATRVRFGLTDGAGTRALWPHAFDLELAVTVGETLHVALTARNTGNEPFTVTGALHTYLTVGDVTRIRIRGLEGLTYVDKVDGYRRKMQSGPVTISAETDRVYLDATGPHTIDDPALGRSISVTKWGSRSTVVWNPWEEKARAIADFGADEYLHMVCVEAANALDDAVTLAPGAAHTLATELSVTDLSPSYL